MSLFFCILRNYLQNRSPCKTSEELSDDPSPSYPLCTVYTAWRCSTLQWDAPFFHVRILLPGTLTLGCPLVSSCSPSRARQKPHLHHREQPSVLGARCPISPPRSFFPLLSSAFPSSPLLCSFLQHWKLLYKAFEARNATHRDAKNERIVSNFTNLLTPLRSEMDHCFGGTGQDKSKPPQQGLRKRHPSALRCKLTH